MAVTPSTMLALGTPAPAFDLPEVDGTRRFSLDSFSQGRGLLVMFISRHCPYVKHVGQELARLGKEYSARGVGIVAISSNDVAKYPDDAPANLARFARDLGIEFPVCYDEFQAVAKAYRAACTPDFFLFDQDRKLFYRGQLDDSRPGNDRPVTGKDLREAIEAVLAGGPAPAVQKPSIGCNIKWKAGNEPDYFG